jgi:hypothetical protein
MHRLLQSPVTFLILVGLIQLGTTAAAMLVGIRITRMRDALDRLRRGWAF